MWLPPCDTFGDTFPTHSAGVMRCAVFVQSTDPAGTELLRAGQTLPSAVPSLYRGGTSLLLLAPHKAKFHPHLSLNFVETDEAML